MYEYEPQHTPEVWPDRKSDCDMGDTTSHSNELSEEEEEVDKGEKMEDNETERKSKTGVVMTALMKLSGIRIDSYPQMYRKYRNDRRRLNAEEDLNAALTITLTIVDRISRRFPGNKCVQDCLGVSEDLVTHSLTQTVFDVRTIGNVVDWLREFSTISTHRPTSDYSPPLEKRPRYDGEETLSEGRNTPLNDGRQPSFTVSPSRELQPKPRWVDTSGTLKSVFIRNDERQHSIKSSKINGDYAVKLHVYNMDEISGLQIHDWWEAAEFRAFLPVRARSSANRAVQRLREELVDVINSQPDVKRKHDPSLSFPP